MSRAIAAVLPLLLLTTARDAGACSCIHTSTCQRFARAGTVFAGDVLEVTESTPAKVARMRVTRAYKGSLAVGATIDVRMPRGSSASCSLDVRQGDRYVIYGAGGAGGVSTSLCQGSFGLRPGDPLPDLPPPGGRVTGALYRLGPPSFDRTPIGEARVWVMTQDGQVETRTDADGRFTLTGVPAGAAVVRFDVGPGERAEERIHLQSADDCAEVYVIPRPAGRLIGAVLDRDGKPVPEAHIAVAAADGSKASGATTQTGRSGAFSIAGLEPGRYVVAVGLGRAPNATFPYTPVFHPGVTERRLAQPVEIGAATVTLPALRLGDPLPLTSLTGVIVCRDGTTPGSAFLTAERLVDGQPQHPRDYGSSDPVNGRYAVTVLRGQRYAVRGVVTIRVRSPDGSEGRTWRDTDPIEVSSDTPPPGLRLVSTLDGCGDPKGVLIIER